MTEVLLETFMLPDSEADLFEELRRAGYEPKRGEIVETRDAHLPDIVLRIVEDVGHDAAMVLLGIAIEWVRGTLRERRRRGAVMTRVLYGPKGEVAARVVVEEDED